MEKNVEKKGELNVKLIGLGGSSKVYQVFNTEKRCFEARRIQISRIQNKSAEEIMWRKLKKIKDSQDPTVSKTKLIDIKIENDDIVMECGLGTLDHIVKEIYSLLDDKKKFESFLITFTIQILDQMVLLEENNIFHHDIKPQNIIVDALVNAKLIDFAYAAEYGQIDMLYNLSVGTLKFAHPVICHNILLNKNILVKCKETQCLFIYPQEAERYSLKRTIISLIEATLKSNDLKINGFPKLAEILELIYPNEDLTHNCNAQATEDDLNSSENFQSQEAYTKYVESISNSSHNNSYKFQFDGCQLRDLVSLNTHSSMNSFKLHSNNSTLTSEATNTSEMSNNDIRSSGSYEAKSKWSLKDLREILRTKESPIDEETLQKVREDLRNNYFEKMVVSAGLLYYFVEDSFGEWLRETENNFKHIQDIKSACKIMLLGHFEFNKENYIKGADLLNYGLNLFEKIQDDSPTKEEKNLVEELKAICYFHMGNCYRRQRNFEEAARNHKLSFKIFESLKKISSAARSLTNLGLVYSEDNKLDLSLEVHNEAENILREQAQEQQEKALRIQILSHKMMVFLELNKRSEENLYKKELEETVEILESNVDLIYPQSRPFLYLRLAKYYQIKNDLKKANDFLKLCLEYRLDNNGIYHTYTGHTFILLSENCLLMGDIERAESYLNDASVSILSEKNQTRAYFLEYTKQVEDIRTRKILVTAAKVE